MGYDPFSPIAPALINVLCIPAGQLGPTKFANYVKWLQRTVGVTSLASSRTSSRKPDVGDDLPVRKAKSTPTLLLNFVAHVNASAVLHTAFFEPNRQPQIVLGLIDGVTLPVNDSDLQATLLQARTRLLQTCFQYTKQEIPVHLLVFDFPSQLEVSEALCVRTDSNQGPVTELITYLFQAVTRTTNQALTVLQTSQVEFPVSSDSPDDAEARRDDRADDLDRPFGTTSSGLSATQTSVVSQDELPAMTAGRTISASLLKLQMGLWTEALDQFSDGARAARDANSPAWHAKALEGILICLLLLSWSGQGQQIPQNCYPTSQGLSSNSVVHAIADANRAVSERFAGTNTFHLQGLTAMIPGLLATIMNLYDRSAIGFDNGLPRLLVCEARVRFATLLCTIRKHEGLLNAAALEDLVGSRHSIGAIGLLDPPNSALTLRPTALASLLVESISEAQAQLPIQSGSAIYLTVCQKLSDMHLDRKQGFYLKEILQRLPPVLVEARRLRVTGPATHTPVGGLTSFASTDKSHERVALGVRALLRLTIESYGLPDTLVNASNTVESSIDEATERRISSWLLVFQSGSIATILEVLRLCIRVSDALPDLSGSVQFMSLLLFIARQTVTVSSGSANAVPLIAAEEQRRLVNGISNAVSTARSLGSTSIQGVYWDDFLVRDIESGSGSSTGALMHHSSKDLSLTRAAENSKKDPFIYNPFSDNQKSMGPALLVKDEIASFDVLLQNPLEIDIEVESIELCVEGSEFDANTHSVVIGPLCAQLFTLTGTPREAGSLKITGCKVKVKNCHERLFTIYNGVWRPPQIVKRRQSSQKLEVESPLTKTLELKIVDPLPQLHISSTSVAQMSLMLLEGEKSSFTVTLQNSGDIPADFILFSFQDSVSAALQETLLNKDLQPADQYELQQRLIMRPTIVRVTDSSGRTMDASNNIPANSKRIFEFEVLGKLGLTEATILIDYAYIGKPRHEVESTFYTRQLRFAIDVTVKSSVDIPRCNVLSLPTSAQHILSPQSKGKASATIVDRNMDSEHNNRNCLLQLDLRGIWQSPLAATIHISTDRNTPQIDTQPRDIATTTVIQPTHTERALILFPRIHIANPFAPIPSLDTRRQFVVTAPIQTLEAEMASRESFWYREELCKRLRITWKEEYGKRQGDIDIRKGIRLSARMIDSLKVEHVQISFDLVAQKEDDLKTVVTKAMSEFEVPRNLFAKLIVRVRNLRQEELRLLLRLQPGLTNQPHNIATDLSKKFVWSGVLQRVLPGGLLKPNETKQIELGIVCLVAGTYEINATVEEIKSHRRQIEGMPNSVSERRIWHARRPCLITAVEP